MGDARLEKRFSIFRLEHFLEHAFPASPEEKKSRKRREHKTDIWNNSSNDLFISTNKKNTNIKFIENWHLQIVDQGT